MPFQSTERQDYEAIVAKLLETDAELQQAEAAAPRAQFNKALGRATVEDLALLDRLPVLRDERDTLRTAKDVAEQHETDRRETAKQRELASRIRAAQQHLSRLERELMAAAVHLGNGQAAYDRAAEASRSALALLPPALREQHWMQLSAKHLKRLILADAHRNAKEAGAAEPLIDERVGYSNDMRGWQSGRLPPLTALLLHFLGPIKNRLRELMPTKSFSGAEEAAGEDDPAEEAAA